MKKQFVTAVFMVLFFSTMFAQMSFSVATIKDGEYNFQDNKKTLKIVIKNDALEKFELNGVLIPEKDYAKYEEIINDLMNNLQKHQKAMNDNVRARMAHKKGEVHKTI
jgi:hypothetical protein